MDEDDVNNYPAGMSKNEPNLPGGNLPKANQPPPINPNKLSGNSMAVAAAMATPRTASGGIANSGEYRGNENPEQPQAAEVIPNTKTEDPKYLHERGPTLGTGPETEDDDEVEEAEVEEGEEGEEGEEEEQ